MEKLTIRLGPLAGPLAERCERTGETPSEVVRKALARLLGEPLPEMPEGNPGLGAIAHAAAAKRWGKKPARKRRK